MFLLFLGLNYLTLTAIRHPAAGFPHPAAGKSLIRHRGHSFYAGKIPTYGKMPLILYKNNIFCFSIRKINHFILY